MGKLNYTTQKVAELLAKIGNMPEISEILTRQHAENSYQPKGDYQPSGSYLTESALVPYATVAALEALTQAVEALQTSISALENRFNTLLGDGDVSAVIDSFAEMEAFLSGITNAQTLTGMLSDMRAEIVALIPTGTAKQSDLASVSGRVTTLETSSASHDSGIEMLQAAMAKRPALPDSTEQGAIYAVKNGAYVCLVDADEQLISTARN